MGRSGVKRRKPARHLRQGPKGTLPYGDPPSAVGGGPPGVIWPAGFEASPYSPAGRIQRLSWLVDAFRRRRGRGHRRHPHI